MADLIGWFGTVLFGIGGIMLAYKMRPGFLILFMANLCYLVVGGLVELYSLAAVSLIMSLIDMWGWLKWADYKNY